MPNLFMIGDLVAYEGMKRGGKKGFDMTHRETHKDALHDMATQFDDLFHRSQQNTPGNKVLAELHGFYDQALAAYNGKTSPKTE